MCVGPLTVKGESKMCHFITQHNEGVASFKGVCSWRANYRNVH